MSASSSRLRLRRAASAAYSLGLPRKGNGSCERLLCLLHSPANIGVMKRGMIVTTRMPSRATYYGGQKSSLQRRPWKRNRRPGRSGRSWAATDEVQIITPRSPSSLTAWCMRIADFAIIRNVPMRFT